MTRSATVRAAATSKASPKQGVRTILQTCLMLSQVAGVQAAGLVVGLAVVPKALHPRQQPRGVYAPDQVTRCVTLDAGGDVMHQVSSARDWIACHPRLRHRRSCVQIGRQRAVERARSRCIDRRCVGACRVRAVDGRAAAGDVGASRLRDAFEVAAAGTLALGVIVLPARGKHEQCREAQALGCRCHWGRTKRSSSCLTTPGNTNCVTISSPVAPTKVPVPPITARC